MKVKGALKKGAVFTILHENCTENDAYSLEERYRPTKLIGWNLEPGGKFHPDRSNISDEERQKRSKSMSKLIWINDGNHCRRVSSDKVDQFLNKGWFLGRPYSPRNMSEKSLQHAAEMGKANKGKRCGSNNPMANPDIPKKIWDRRRKNKELNIKTKWTFNASDQ